ncbi:MAG: ABC transporter permease [Spirochaetes bacterium]|nr:ABC transporter permease [Spirochaetota bacterium]
MNKFRASLYAEYLKIIRSKVLIATAAALSLGPIMGSLFVVVLRSASLTESNSLLQSKAAFTGFSPDWQSFLNLLTQVIGVGGVIVFGFAASWVFGREYSDRTAKDLFVLPVSRSLIVISKFIAVLGWSIFLCIEILLLGIITGFILHLPGWSGRLFFVSLYHFSITSFLVILLCTPVAFIASAGKGYLAPLGFVVLSVVLAQIIGALGYGTYFPWAIPAIYSKIIGTQSILNWQSYLILALTSILGLFGTIYWWKYADQTN